MQTFLPYADYKKSAEVPDWRRLGKQRVECLQILKACHALRNNLKYGWQHHPCTVMWYGHEFQLCEYMNAIITEWVARGYKNNMTVPYELLHKGTRYTIRRGAPWWLGDERLHSSHRAVLLKKDPNWYGQFGWGEGPEATVWWPETWR